MENNETTHLGVIGTWEPQMSYQVLRRCVKCEGPHPLARNDPNLNPNICPDCGHPQSLGESGNVKAFITDKKENLLSKFKKIINTIKGD